MDSNYFINSLVSLAEKPGQNENDIVVLDWDDSLSTQLFYLDSNGRAEAFCRKVGPIIDSHIEYREKMIGRSAAINEEVKTLDEFKIQIIKKGRVSLAHLKPVVDVLKKSENRINDIEESNRIIESALLKVAENGHVFTHEDYKFQCALMLMTTPEVALKIINGDVDAISAFRKRAILLEDNSQEELPAKKSNQEGAVKRTVSPEIKHYNRKYEITRPSTSSPSNIRGRTPEAALNWQAFYEKLTAKPGIFQEYSADFVKMAVIDQIQDWKNKFDAVLRGDKEAMAEVAFACEVYECLQGVQSQSTAANGRAAKKASTVSTNPMSVPGSGAKPVPSAVRPKNKSNFVTGSKPAAGFYPPKARVSGYGATPATVTTKAISGTSVNSVRYIDEVESVRSNDPQRLMGGLKRLGINSPTAEAIVKLNPHSMDIVTLENNLKYVCYLSDAKIKSVLSFVKEPSEIEGLKCIREKQEQEDQSRRAYEIDQVKRAEEKQRAAAKFNYDNDFELALELSKRNIMDSKFVILAIGSKIDDETGGKFDENITVFADGGGHSDLDGDIHETVDYIPSGKKFEEIHITGLPGTVFNNPEKNMALFCKLNSLMEVGGELVVEFGLNDPGYNNQSFAENVLNPLGFVMDGSVGINSGKNGVRLTAHKMGEVDSSSHRRAEERSLNAPLASRSVTNERKNRHSVPVKSSVPDRKPASWYETVDNVENRITNIINYLKEEYNLSYDNVGIIMESIRFIEFNEAEIKGASLGCGTALEKILMQCMYSKFNTNTPKALQSPLYSAGLNHVGRSEDAIDGAGATRLGQSKYGSQQPGIEYGDLANRWNDVETDGVGPMGVGALEENVAFESINNYSIFQSPERREGVMEKLKDYFNIWSPSITINKELFEKFVDENKGNLKQDYILAALGHDNNVKSVARLYDQWLNANNTVSNRLTRSPVFVPNGGARPLPDGAQYIRKEYPACHVNSFMMDRDVEADGAMALEPMTRPVYPGGSAANIQAQYHEQAFRAELEGHLNTDDPLVLGETPSLLQELLAMAQRGKRDMERLAKARSYPVNGYSHGDVSVKEVAGIQAAGNNCAIASALMAMTYKGSLRLFIAQIEEALDKAQGLRASLRTNTANAKTNRDNATTLKAIERLQQSLPVLVKYDSEQFESIRVNNGAASSDSPYTRSSEVGKFSRVFDSRSVSPKNDLDDIRKVFQLENGRMLDVDEFFGQMIADLRRVQSSTNCSKRIEVFNFPVDKRPELQGMSMASALTRFYLEEITENPDSRLEDTEILILAPPSFGQGEKVAMELSPEVEKFNTLGESIKYRFVASVNVSGLHYVTFLKDEVKGLLYLADSMGMRVGTDHMHQVTVPTITSMPIHGTKQALESAISAAENGSEDQSHLKLTKERWEGMAKNCRLAIYQKVNNR